MLTTKTRATNHHQLKTPLKKMDMQHILLFLPFLLGGLLADVVLEHSLNRANPFNPAFHPSSDLSGIWNKLCLPSILLDRSNVSIHCFLLQQQVPDTALRNTEYVHVMHIMHIMHFMHVMHVMHVLQHHKIRHAKRVSRFSRGCL